MKISQLLSEGVNNIEVNIDGKLTKYNESMTHDIWFRDITYGDILSQLGSTRRTGLTFHTDTQQNTYILDIYSNEIFDGQTVSKMLQKFKPMGAKIVQGSGTNTLHVIF